MKNILPFFILITLFIAGCSPRTAILLDEYREHNISGKKLTIIKLFERPTILNPDDVVDDLGDGVPDEVYASFFKNNILQAFKKSNCCTEVDFLEKVSVSDFEQKILDINEKEKMKILMPKENRIIKNDSINADFILFLDNLQISRTPGSSGTWINETFSGGSFDKLYHQIYFVLWDNINGKLVSYGRIFDESTVVFGMTKDNWKSVLDGLASRILKYTPFPVKYGLYH